MLVVVCFHGRGTGSSRGSREHDSLSGWHELLMLSIALANADSAPQASLVFSVTCANGLPAAAPGAIKPQAPSPAPPPQQPPSSPSPSDVVNGPPTPPSPVLPNSYAAFQLAVSNLTVDQFTPAAQQVYLNSLAQYFANESFSSIAILRIESANSSGGSAAGPTSGGQGQSSQLAPALALPPSSAAGPTGAAPPAFPPWPHHHSGNWSGSWSGMQRNSASAPAASPPQQPMSGNPGAVRPLSAGGSQLSTPAQAPAPTSSRRLLQNGNSSEYSESEFEPTIYIWTSITLTASADLLFRLENALEDDTIVASFIGPNQAPGTVVLGNEFLSGASINPDA